jgi:hypothetical protein
MRDAGTDALRRTAQHEKAGGGPEEIREVREPTEEWLDGLHHTDLWGGIGKPTVQRGDGNGHGTPEGKKKGVVADGSYRIPTGRGEGFDAERFVTFDFLNVFISNILFVDCMAGF